MGSATPIDFNEVAKDMIDLIAENKDIDRWIDEKAKIESEAWGEGVLKKMQEKSDVLQPAGGTTFDENFCLSHLLKYTYNVAMLQRQRKILEDYLIYVQNDNKIYGTDTAMGSKNLHQMKALYTSQYTILVDFWIKRFRIIYYFILVVYIGILVKNRKQFNQPIGKFQSVANRIVEMKLRLETSRLLLYKTASLKEKGENAILESAMLKLHLSESFLLSSLDSIRNFGGSAYLTDHGIERDLRDSVGGILYAGTSDIQRNIIAKLLGL